MKKLKVMIAEDNQELLRELIRFLNKKFEIIAAVEDGGNLVDGAILLQPDVIVSDFLMPHFTGFQALQELTTQGYSIPFVFVSANPELISQGPWSIVDKMDISSELEAAVYAAGLGEAYISRRAHPHKGP